MSTSDIHVLSNENLKKEKAKSIALTIILVVIGSALLSIGTSMFLNPLGLYAGGVTGIAALTFYATGIPINNTYFLINIFLLIAALKILGYKFLVKTIYAILMLTVLLGVFQKLVTQPDGSMYQLLGEGEVFMSLILGACFTGAALAIVFLHNGSTGGTDIIAAIVNKYRDISLGRVLIVADLLIILSSYFIFQDWRKIVFGLGMGSTEIAHIS